MGPINSTVVEVLWGNDEYSAWCTHPYHFYNSGLTVFLAVDHGANRHRYDGAASPMLHSTLAHRIDVTSVLAHSIFAAFFLVWLQADREFLVLCDLVRVCLRAPCVCVVSRNFLLVRPNVSIGQS